MKIETKYNIGDTVYVLEGYEIIGSVILGVDFQQHGTASPFIQYRFALYKPHRESECFPTKQDLINFLNK